MLVPKFDTSTIEGMTTLFDGPYVYVVDEDIGVDTVTGMPHVVTAALCAAVSSGAEGVLLHDVANAIAIAQTTTATWARRDAPPLHVECHVSLRAEHTALSRDGIQD